MFIASPKPLLLTTQLGTRWFAARDVRCLLMTPPRMTASSHVLGSSALYGRMLPSLRTWRTTGSRTPSVEELLEISKDISANQKLGLGLTDGSSKCQHGKLAFVPQNLVVVVQARVSSPRLLVKV